MGRLAEALGELMKKFAKLLGATALIAAVITVIAGHMRGNSDTPLQSGESSQPAASDKPDRPSNGSARNKSANAVVSAAQAIDSLSVAPFLPKTETKQLLQAIVVAGQTNQLLKAFAYSGPLLAAKLGYPTTDDARYRAGYYVATKMYRVEQFNGRTAVISLYTESHFVTSQNQRYLVPSISVVKMQLQGGKWLYAGSSDPPAGQAPPPKRYLSYAETVARYQPYLKGYSSYVEK